jgi:uncharacterized protein YcfJ
LDRDSNPDVRSTGNVVGALVERLVGAVRLRGSAQRAVRDADSAVAQGQVEHLVDLGDVLRDGERLVALDHAEHDRVVGVPVAAGGVGRRRIVERRDAPAVAGAGVAELAVVDQHPAPADESPVDGGVGIGEERLPLRLEQQEQHRLVDSVVGVVGGVPGDQVVGGAEPDAAFAVGIVGEGGAGQLFERVDEFVPVVVAGTEEPHEVGDVPGVAGVARLGQVGDGLLVDLADGELAPMRSIASRVAASAGASAGGAAGAGGYRNVERRRL